MKRYQITFKGQIYELDVEEINIASSGVQKPVPASPIIQTPSPTPVVPKAATHHVGAQTVVAPMPGKILEVNVKVGDSIKRGDLICVLEAMKMKNEIVATQDGEVSDVRVFVGQTISTGDIIIVTG